MAQEERRRRREKEKKRTMSVYQWEDVEEKGKRKYEDRSMKKKTEMGEGERVEVAE